MVGFETLKTESGFSSELAGRGDKDKKKEVKHLLDVAQEGRMEGLDGERRGLTTRSVCVWEAWLIQPDVCSALGFCWTWSEFPLHCHTFPACSGGVPCPRVAKRHEDGGAGDPVPRAKQLPSRLPTPWSCPGQACSCS